MPRCGSPAPSTSHDGRRIKGKSLWRHLPTLHRLSIASRPALLQSARQTPMATLLEMNRVVPSPIDVCTPPECRLREAIIVGVEAVAKRQGGFSGLLGVHWPPL